VYDYIKEINDGDSLDSQDFKHKPKQNQIKKDNKYKLPNQVSNSKKHSILKRRDKDAQVK